MSEKFGINWKKMDTNRAQEFISIMRYDGERTNRENQKYGGRTTKRNR